MNSFDTSDDLLLDEERDAPAPLEPADGSEESSRDDSIDSEQERPSNEAERSPGASDDADYSARVRKRIAQEVALRKSAEEERQREAQQNARLAAELAALRADLDSVKNRNAAADAQVAEGALQAKVQAARQRLATAKANLDYDEELAALDAYNELQAELRESRRAAKPSRPERDERDERVAPPALDPMALPGGTRQWLEKNEWYLSGQHPELTALAAHLDTVLAQEGFSRHDPATYQELNRRLKAAAPKSAQIVGEMALPMKSHVPDPGPPSGASSAEGRHTSGPRKLTNDDLRQMERFGLDPDNKEDRRVWLVTHS